MLTSNIDIDDRLMNGLVSRDTQFKYVNNAVKAVHVKFNYDIVGLVARQLDVKARRHHWVIIKNVFKRSILQL